MKSPVSHILSLYLFLAFSLLESNADTTGLRFLLYNKNRKILATEVKAGDPSTFSKFLVNGKVKILCHGYTSNYLLEFPQDLKNSYVGLSDNINVIAVDWSALSSARVGYNQASANTQIVGAEIAALIQGLVTNNITTLDQFHFIGHSLGGQVGAFISSNLPNKQKIPRATGLDPARANFEPSLPASQRLDATDADFVDVINTTNGGIDGTSSTPVDPPRGIVDFYPNGGQNQPGCSMLGIQNRLCSHNRSYKFYTESVTTTVGFKSCKCSNWTGFLNSSCGGCPNSTLMGEYVNKSVTGTYSLKTNANSPYAQG